MNTTPTTNGAHAENTDPRDPTGPAPEDEDSKAAPEEQDESGDPPPPAEERSLDKHLADALRFLKRGQSDVFRAVGMLNEGLDGYGGAEPDWEPIQALPKRLALASSNLSCALGHAKDLKKLLARQAKESWTLSRYPKLEDALASFGGPLRWSPVTVAAARTLEGLEHLDWSDWDKLLDGLDAAIKGVLALAKKTKRH